MSDHNIEWISHLDPKFVKMVLGLWVVKANAKIINVWENVPIKVTTWEVIDDFIDIKSNMGLEEET